MRLFLPVPFAALLLLTSLPALAATPAALQAAQSPTMPGPAGNNLLGKNKGDKLAGLLSPQQRAMFTAGARDQIKDMAPAQRKAWRKQQIAKFLAMTPGDRQKFQADLQAKWDGLPLKQKTRLQQRLASQAPAAQ